jgi:hypothetical protein
MRLNEPNVVFQQFGDEAVIINLAIGKYYSTDKVGADIFGMAAGGVDEAKIQELLSQRWEDVDAQTVPVFLALLLSEQLIVQGDPLEKLDFQYGAFDPKLPFSPPVLNPYEDMQALLLLDPIHDVGEQGWPNRA